MRVANQRALLAPLVLVMALLAGGPLGAAVHTVTNLNDSGAGSLRATCAAAASGDEIVFDAALSGGISFGSQISLGSKALSITGNVTAAGGPAITLNGGNATRLIISNANLTLVNLRFANGYAGTGPGGAVQSGGGEFTCINCVFDGNQAASDNGGALTVYSNQPFLIQDCVFMNCLVPSAWAAGAIQCANSGVISRSVFFNNGAGLGGALLLEAAPTGTVSLVLENCTFTGNVAANTGAGTGGGAVKVYGYSGTTQVDAQNCTFNANTSSATASGQCVSLTADPLPLESATVRFQSRNSIFLDANANVMFAGFTVGTGQTQFVSLGHNLCGDAPAWMNQPGDMVTTDPQLGVLIDNGGATLTHALLPGSPARDAGDPVGAPAIDQRGFARDTMPDIGAFEAPGAPRIELALGGAAVANGVPVALSGSDTPGQARVLTLSVSNAGSNLRDLNLTLPLAISGTINCATTMTSQPMATLGPGEASDFELEVTPAGAGAFQLTLNIASNDPDDNPFVLTISGLVPAPPASTEEGDDDGDCRAGTGALPVPLLLALAVLLAGRGTRRVRLAFARAATTMAAPTAVFVRRTTRLRRR